MRLFGKAPKSSKRLKIVTAFDPGFAEIGAYASRSIRRYAETFGHDWEALPLPVTGRPPAWAKIEVIRKVLADGYEFVLWVDADACFVRADEDILGEIQENKHLYIVSHLLALPEKQVAPAMFLSVERPNTGVMLMRNGPWTHALLDRIWNKTEYINHAWWENAAFMDVMGFRYELTGRVEDQYLDTELLHSVKFLTLDWNSTPSLRERQALQVYDPIILHCAGMKREMRLHFLQRYALS